MQYDISNMAIFPLTYSDNLISQYQALLDLPGFILLESSDHQRGRYDILTALPYDTLTIERTSPDIYNAFDLLKKKLPIISSNSSLPFQGGAIGYIAYDVGAILAGIQPIPHAFNDMPLIDMRFYDWAIIVDHYLQTVNFVAAHYCSETASQVKEIIDRWESLPKINDSFELQQVFVPLISETDYKTTFNTIQEALSCGRSYQVNYTQPFIGQYSGDSWELYKRVRLRNPVPYAAFMRCAKGDILSFSPEQFLSFENGLVQTSPIKGTANRSPIDSVDAQLRTALLNSEKNLAENVMIVDLLRNDLGKFAIPGSVKVESLCQLESFRDVHHLVSKITARCPQALTPIDVFAHCFPGGSVTGAPKLETMKIINELEAYARGVYCGSIAYFSMHGRFDSNIAIRTIVAKKDSLYLSVGGGIVIDSNWEDEYRECFTKISAIVNGLMYGS